MTVAGTTRRTSRFGPITVTFDERVLTPRPWTLLQSEWAAELSATAGPGPILELCAGAGQIGLAAAVLSGRELVQVEADEVAAGYATANAAAAGRAAEVQVRCGLVDAVLRPDETFPIVLADPPYLPSRDITRWPGDPVRAIDGGPDGLDVVRLCLAVAADHLVAGGPLLLQVAGDAQADAVRAVVDADPRLDFREVRRHDAERAVVLVTRQPAPTGP